MNWRSPGAEIRCIAPARSDNGSSCGRMVTRVPDGWRFRVVGLVAHTSLASEDALVFACTRCGHWHEIRAETAELRLADAA